MPAVFCLDCRLPGGGGGDIPPPSTLSGCSAPSLGALSPDGMSRGGGDRPPFRTHPRLESWRTVARLAATPRYTSCRHCRGEAWGEAPERCGSELDGVGPGHRLWTMGKCRPFLHPRSRELVPE